MTELGFEWATPTHEITGYLYPRWSNPTVGNAGEGYFDFFDTVLADGGMRVDVYLATPAISLVTEGGDAEAGKGAAVVGVNAEGPDGTSYVVRAPKVVLACGGFSGSPDLLRQYNTQWSYPEGNIPTTNVNGHTGDGIKMAIELGAATADMGNQMLFPFNDPVNFSFEDIMGSFGDSPVVNQSGNRFVDETTDRFTISAAMMEQTDNLGFFVCDKKCSDYPSEERQETLLRRGLLYKADTLEDLATQMGGPTDAFVDQIATYNGYVEGGTDEEFGKQDMTAPIATAPFHAVRMQFFAHDQMGGILANTKAQVCKRSQHFGPDPIALDDQEVIPHLYAAGECVGGYVGEDRGHGKISIYMVFGRIAGQNAALETPVA